MALKARPEVRDQVGAVGYCPGGRLAFLAAARLGVDAAVSYYGTRMDGHLDEVKSVRCPIMFHFGGSDAAVPPETREKMRAAFGAHDDKDAEFYVYADAVAPLGMRQIIHFVGFCHFTGCKRTLLIRNNGRLIAGCRKAE
jgi:carboxymethylenebutenolidase